MKALSLPLLCTLSLLVSFAPAHADIEVVMTLSEDPGSPWEDVGSAFVGEQNLYLWLLGAHPAGAVEFGLSAEHLEILDLTPSPGLLNLGTATSPILVPTGDCLPEFPYVATLRVRDATGAGGRICFDFSAQNTRSCWQGCADSEWWQFSFTAGYRTEGTSGICGVSDPNCRPLPVDPHTWGRVKALYR